MSKKSKQDDLQQQDAEPSSKWEKFAKNKEEEPATEQVEVADAEPTTETGDIDLVAKLEQLEIECAAAQDQAKQSLADALRYQADSQNTERRAQNQVSQARLYANEKLVTELLPILDSMARAQEGVNAEDPQAQSMLEGITLTFELLEKTLVKFGLEILNPEQGEAFNPECHEAMQMQSGTDADKNTIIQVVQKGYALNGRVIRAAMVIVAG
jgi:molecular chaperone GrpE